METRVKWMPYSTKERIHVRAFSMNQVYIWKCQKPSGKPKKPKRPRQKLSKTIGKTKTNKKTFRPMSAKVDMGLKVLLFLFVLVFSMVFDSFCLDLFGFFGFFGFPDDFDIFKCTFDSSKRLGRGCAPLLNKAFHFTRVSMYKRLPCIVDFPL